MTAISAPTALYLSTLPVVPNNKNQLATWITAVTDRLNGTTAVTETMTLGAAQTYPTGNTYFHMPNLDSAYPGWYLAQRYYDHALLARNDTLLTLGYNWDANEREDTNEPAWFLQLESYDASQDGVTPTVTGGFNYQHTDGVNTRPVYWFIRRDTGEADATFESRFSHFATVDTVTMLHLAEGAVGVHTYCNASAQFHIKANVVLWESSAGSANNKYWDISCDAGDTFNLRAVNDAYAAAGTVFSVSRSGATPTRFTFGSLKISATLTDYANNAAAVSGGLAVGDLYQTSGTVKVVTA